MSIPSPDSRDPSEPPGTDDPSETARGLSGVSSDQRRPATPHAASRGVSEDLALDPDLDVVVTAGTAPSRRRPSGRADPRVLLAVSLGAMGGATARYRLATWIPAAAGEFPWATFWTNVSGSLVLGFLLVLLIERFPPTRYARAFAGTGFLGAYTTFSTFSVETDVLIKDGHASMAAIYVVASLVVGVTVAWVGVLLGRRLPYHRLARRERP